MTGPSCSSMNRGCSLFSAAFPATRILWPGRTLKTFFGQIERPRGIHLCGNPDWDFLLQQDMEILSFDAYRNGPIFTQYQKSIQKFLDRGGILSWGLVPTQTELFSQESVPSLIERLEGFWEGLYRLGFDREQLLVSEPALPGHLLSGQPRF